PTSSRSAAPVGCSVASRICSSSEEESMAMTRRDVPRRAALAAALLLWLGATASQAQVVTIKMATLVPEGSSWHTILKEVAEKWKTISGGRVVVKLYAGGVAGDDPEVVRKMRLGTLNAGVLTSVGLGEIDK